MKDVNIQNVHYFQNFNCFDFRSCFVLVNNKEFKEEEKKKMVIGEEIEGKKNKDGKKN